MTRPLSYHRHHGNEENNSFAMKAEPPAPTTESNIIPLQMKAEPPASTMKSTAYTPQWTAVVLHHSSPSDGMCVMRQVPKEPFSGSILNVRKCQSRCRTAVRFIENTSCRNRSPFVDRGDSGGCFAMKKRCDTTGYPACIASLKRRWKWTPKNDSQYLLLLLKMKAWR